MQKVGGILIPSTFAELLESRFGPKANPETDIYGSGYGSSHWWQESGLGGYVGLDGKEHSEIGGPSRYRCGRCGVVFLHYYNKTRNIFEAIKQAGIPDVCHSPVSGE